MLASKRSRPRLRKPDWFSSKVRVHFDLPLPRAEAERLVTDPVAVARHSFLPLIGFSKKERRYRRRVGTKKPAVIIKFRELAYPANRDGYIFAYYAEKLGELYESELAAQGLGTAVIGDRKGASNIRLARNAFAEISSRDNCVAFAFDIKGFFDNINHKVLKERWSYLLGGTMLPDDHYAVFRALTVAAKIERGELLQRLGYSANSRDRDLRRPLCSISHYRDLRSGSPGTGPLVHRYKATQGIPQGTPLSAMAANISMLNFDIVIQDMVTSCGGSYRRYSDDILIIVPPDRAAGVEAAVEAALVLHTKTLKLNADKTEVVHFAQPGPTVIPQSPASTAKPLQYLGFTFDGRNVRIRSGTLARYYRRMASATRAAKIRAWLAKEGKIFGRTVIHTRDVLAKHSHLGTDSFVSRYAKDSAKTMTPLGSEPIRQQLAGHVRVLRRRLKS